MLGCKAIYAIYISHIWGSQIVWGISAVGLPTPKCDIKLGISKAFKNVPVYPLLSLFVVGFKSMEKKGGRVGWVEEVEEEVEVEGVGWVEETLSAVFCHQLLAAAG